jgi:hypothetical protein
MRVALDVASLMAYRLLLHTWGVMYAFGLVA